MLVKNPDHHLAYSSVHTSGILHRNWRGKWYPVCSRPDTWAMEVCDSELGTHNLLPSISKQSSILTGPFIHGPFERLQEPGFSEVCEMENNKNSVIFVTCPAPKCGTSKLNEMSVHKPTFIRNYNAPNLFNIRYRRNDEPEGRIVGGVDSGPLDWPFIVVIYRNGHFHCGGTIYNEEWVKIDIP